MQIHHSTVAEAFSADDWRRATRAKLLWLLLAKLATLLLLWVLFFSPAQRQRVDVETAESHFAISAVPAASGRQGLLYGNESKATSRD